MFFFPAARLERIESVAYKLELIEARKDKDIFENARYSRKLSFIELEDFHFRCEEYFGLGFVASFFPGTSAYKARRVLSKEEEESPSLTPTHGMYSAVGSPREGSSPVSPKPFFGSISSSAADSAASDDEVKVALAPPVRKPSSP